MKWDGFGKTGCALAALLLVPGISMAKPATCVAEKPTPASYSWNFSTEARQLIQDLRADAADIHDHADKLKALADSDEVSWHTHGEELAAISNKIDEMGQKLCRLETIRRVVSPWERAAIDSAMPNLVLIRDDADNAIHFLNVHEGQMWMPTYRVPIDNLASLSGRMSNSLKEYVEYAHVHREDIQLHKDLGMKTGS